MLVHGGMKEFVLFLQGFVVLGRRVFVTRFIVGALDLAETAFEDQTGATLALIALVDGPDGPEEQEVGNGTAKARPKSVPRATLVIGPREGQKPVNDDHRLAPSRVMTARTSLSVRRGVRNSMIDGVNRGRDDAHQPVGEQPA